MSHYWTVCRAHEVPAGEARLFVVNETMVGVFNLDGEFFALDNRCPHEGASLAHGYLDGDIVSCRIHHWRFCIRDGTYLDEEKPRCNARTFATRVIGDQVQVALD